MKRNPALTADLIEALRLLAADAEVQRASLPIGVAMPDEVGLTYLDAFAVVDHEQLPASAHRALDELAAALEMILTDDSRSDLGPESLATSSAWADVRHSAAALLSQLGAPFQAPRLR
jgi:hypothetical protein